jgi:hypothetical protein
VTDQWYYGRGTDISGPVTGVELMALATSGEVLRTDTVWREGNENGVAADRVKNLFGPLAKGEAEVRPPGEDSPAAPAVPGVEAEVAPSETADAPAAPVAAPPPPPAPVAAAPRKGRATAGKGAVIVGQDGKSVKFRGKCLVCGREEGGYKSITIPRGTTRTSFYCAKCRKRGDIEIHGSY